MTLISSWIRFWQNRVDYKQAYFTKTVQVAFSKPG